MSYFLIKGVPYYRQFHDVVDASIRNRSCGPTTFKMGAEFVSGIRLPSIDELYREATAIQSCMIAKGTITAKAVEGGIFHDALMAAGRNYGISSYPQEFRSLEPVSRDKNSRFADEIYQKGIGKIKMNLRDNRPVMVSVYRNMDRYKGTLHPVLLVGYQEGCGFFYHDSDGEEDKPRREFFVTDRVFDLCWRRMAIFFE